MSDDATTYPTMKNRCLLSSFLWLLLLFSDLRCATVPSRSLIAPTDDQVDVSRWNRTSGCCSASGSRIAIASGGSHSSRAGLEIASAGGNIVDSAVAVAFALCVERPQSTGIGGGGFATVRLKEGVEQFVDFRETAPAQASRTMYLDESGAVRAGGLSQVGIFAVATPGFVAGMWEMHQKWGKLPWSRVLQPAIRLADEGFTIYPILAQKIEASKKHLGRLPHTQAVFFDGKKPKGVGDRLIQKDLAASLQAIAEKGPDVFYRGEIAKRIIATSRQYGGFLSAEDLSSYQVKFRKPLSVNFGGYRVLTSPPPSAGGVILVQALKVWNGLPPSRIPRNEADYVHLLAEIFKRSYAERSQAIGDPDFVRVPLGPLTSDDFARKVRSQISADKATPSNTIRPGLPEPETHGTTGFTIIDDQGNAISSTITINTRFGSHVMVPKTGIILNNEMDDFSIKPGEKNAYGLTGGSANAIAPGKRPVSSMTPSLVLRANRPVLAVSAAGGSRIITSVVQTTINYMSVFPGDLERSVFAPRMHHQWLPDELDLEAGFLEETKTSLKGRGHRLSDPDWDPIVTAVGGEGGRFTSVTDPRDEGGAVAQ